MSVAKVIEVSASSPDGFEAAIQEAITKSKETVRGIKSAWVKEQQVRVDTDGNVTEYQVNVMITFVVD
jgi:flavin-binding protein dodecin